jgi:hypothetical protein
MRELVIGVAAASLVLGACASRRGGASRAAKAVWHETEVLARLADGTVRMAVDGVEVTRYRDEDAARLRKGPIGLQIHAGASEVEYKDLQVEISPIEDRLLTVKAAPVQR